MHAQRLNGGIDRFIGELAGRQQGAVARWQLLAAGIGEGAVDHRVARGILRPIHRGVYLVGHAAPARYSREMAAALAVGSGAVVSHRSAAAMMEILRYPAKGDVWIVTATGHSQGRSGIRVQRTRVLAPRDTGRIDGVAVTSPARTLVDLAAVVEPDWLELAVAEAQVKRLVRTEDLRAQLQRSRKRPGVGRLRALLDRTAEPAYTKSLAERKMLSLIRSARLPEPEVNVHVGRFLVDFFWREQRVVAEFDSYEFHSHSRAFERDRDRTNELQLQGYTVLRFAWRHLTREPRRVEVRLRRALEVASDSND